MHLKALPSLLTTILLAASVSAEELRFYVGTYTKPGGSEGIYTARLDVTTGAVTPLELAVATTNPTFLAAHPKGGFLYSAGENGGGSANAFAIESTGKLREISQESSGGGGACHIWVDGAGRHALVANYGGGSVAALPIKEDGSLGKATGFVQHSGSSVNPQRQKGPHAHSIYTGPGDRAVYACDLGLDKVLIYRLGPDGSLIPGSPESAAVPPGSGPRHLDFTPDGKYCYVINELTNTVTTFAHESSSGKLTEVETISSLPAGYEGKNSTAEIFVHPSGKFVYGSNRGHDSIVVYAVDAASGRLRLVEHTSTQGKGPRNFAIEPGGRFLLAANQQTDNVVIFQIDQQSGKLTPTGHTFACKAPVCIEFVKP